MRFIADLETNGLLDEVTKIHCLVAKDIDTGEIHKFTPQNIEDGVKLLASAELLVFHNGIKFDHAVLEKLYPQFPIEKSVVFDTLVAVRLIWANIKDTDNVLLKKEQLPGKMFGSHSLAAWGYRLGNYKGDYSGGWETFSEEMLEYNIQDVEVTHNLFEKIQAEKYSEQALELEHQVAWLMAQQERNGFCFDMTKASTLLARLVQRRGELERELKDYFGSWVIQLPDFIPKVNNKTRGYVKGVPVTKTKTIEFNPSSRDHIADRLITLYGWKPTDFTEGGKPQVDEIVLGKLTYPPCKQLTEYLLVQKRISQLNEGTQAWMKCEKKGKIHGSINPNGAVTGRATHSYPNISQVPSGNSPYGKDCRELFTVPPGWSLVGADASGLELRCLAHFMAKWDGGKYAEVLLGGDIHTENQKAAGLETRNQAKTFIYAFLYGAGDAKIGSIVGGTASDGRKLKTKFLRSLPALGRLVEAVQQAAKRGYLIGLDGRKVHVRSSHAALNTLLQSAGAMVCKQWIVNVERLMLSRGYTHGWDGDFSFCAFSHDEIQVAIKAEDVVEAFQQVVVEAMAITQQTFNFRCPLACESKVGKDWSDTH